MSWYEEAWRTTTAAAVVARDDVYALSLTLHQQHPQAHQLWSVQRALPVGVALTATDFARLLSSPLA